MFGQKHKKKLLVQLIGHAVIYNKTSCCCCLFFSFLILSRVPSVFDNCHRKGVSEGRRHLVTKFQWIKRSPQPHKKNDLLSERVQRQLVDIENLFV